MDEAAVEAVSESAGAEDESATANRRNIECPICLQVFVLPCKLPCGHIFCFLCVKGLQRDPRCAMCRRNFPVDYLKRPELMEPANVVQAPNSPTEASEYLWLYKGRNDGWWQYDSRTNDEIETAYNASQYSVEVLICGTVYVIDFNNFVQYRRDRPHIQRSIIRNKRSGGGRVNGVAGILTSGRSIQGRKSAPPIFHSYIS